jgi:hypothetical protein
MFGIRLMVVEEGTVIDRNGQQLTVTATDVVLDGDVLWLTQRHYDQLKTTLEIENGKGEGHGE